MPKIIAVTQALKDCYQQLDLESQPTITVRKCVLQAHSSVMEEQLTQEQKVYRAGFGEVNLKSVIEYCLEYKRKEVGWDPLGREVS